jgi:uncharacterized 2Fe-2S/4Fe-4S cluster protein (DUF4445 family)
MPPLHFGDRQLDIDPEKSIFEYANSLRVRVPTSCNRSGECHECIVEIKRGLDALNSPTEEEKFLRDNYRLACQAYVADPDADVEFAILRRQPRILTQSIKRSVPLEPAVSRRGNDVYFGDERIDSYKGSIYGLAVDVGTTTVVMNLTDLESGEVLHTASFENPQRFGGSDIMHRISYDGGEFQGELRQVMLSSLNFEIGWMARELGFHRRNIYEAVIVGNSTMRDILFGIDVQPIGEKPYKSRIEEEMLRGERETTALHTSGRDLGLRIFPKAHVYSGPLIASHVGADVAADLLAIGMDEQDDVVMLVDIGTNTEVVVGNKHRLKAASCPAGPAFEGGEVLYGMPGYVGAVEAVKLHGDSCECRTIDDGEPQGICGSGLIDLLAELRRTGKMNQLGVFADGSKEFFFLPEKGMSLSRADISALAQAKSANFCGQYIVLRNYGVEIDRIDKLYLAGGFANYINTESAVDIGFLANFPQEKIVKVGNASLEGATIMLLNTGMRDVAEEMARKIEHIELETTPDFFDIFVDGCMFDPMTTSIR